MCGASATPNATPFPEFHPPAGGHLVREHAGAYVDGGGVVIATLPCLLKGSID